MEAKLKVDSDSDDLYFVECEIAGYLRIFAILG